jgi:hypothetical protein
MSQRCASCEAEITPTLGWYLVLWFHRNTGKDWPVPVQSGEEAYFTCNGEGAAAEQQPALGVWSPVTLVKSSSGIGDCDLRVGGCGVSRPRMRELHDGVAEHPVYTVSQPPVMIPR